MLDVQVPHPEWGNQLKSLYWVIRVESRNRVKRRRYYRYVRAERLRLVESGLAQSIVDAYCRYLATLNPKAAEKYLHLISQEHRQLNLDF